MKLYQNIKLDHQSLITKCILYTIRIIINSFFFRGLKKNKCSNWRDFCIK